MTKTTTAALWGFACGLAATAISIVPAQAQEGVAFKNLLGSVGIIAPEKDAIHYRERAPLVLPPRMELREPLARAKTASANPQWPKDPDVEAKRRLAEETRRPVTDSEIRRMSENNPRMSVEEIRAGRNPNATTPFDPKAHRGDNARDVLILTPQEMVGAAKVTDEDDVKLANGEPDRKTLSEPPTGFRKATGRLADTSGAKPRVDQQEIDANPMAWITRKFTSAGDDE